MKADGRAEGLEDAVIVLSEAPSDPIFGQTAL